MGPPDPWVPDLGIFLKSGSGPVKFKRIQIRTGFDGSIF